MLSVQLADNHIPGATVAVVKDGRLFFAQGYGDADLQHGKLVSAHRSLLDEQHDELPTYLWERVTWK